jgi:hypothetical protein
MRVPSLLPERTGSRIALHPWMRLWFSVHLKECRMYTAHVLSVTKAGHTQPLPVSESMRMATVLSPAQVARQVLVHQELHVAANEALPATHGRALRL